MTKVRVRSPTGEEEPLVDRLTQEDCASPEQVEDALSFAHSAFERLKGSPRQPGDHLRELRQNLWRLASFAPEAYRTLMADAELRGGLVAIERSSGIQFFASDESNARALRLVSELQLLSAQDLREDRANSEDRESGARRYTFKRQIESKAALQACLRGAAAALRSSEAVPVPRAYAADFLTSAFRFVGPRLLGEARDRGAAFAGEMIGYVSSQAPWLAYRLIAEHSPDEIGESKLAVRMGERFLQTSCTSKEAPEYQCLTVLSMLSSHYSRLGDPGGARSAKQRLDTKIRQSERLKLVLSREKGKPEPLAERWRMERSNLLSLIPRLDDLSLDSPELILARWREAAAISYWLLAAARTEMQGVAGLMELLRNGSRDQDLILTGVFLTMGYSRALELQDGPTALKGAELVYQIFEPMVKDVGASSREILATRAQLLLMKLGAQMAVRNRQESLKIATQIRGMLASVLTNANRDAGSRDVVESCTRPQPVDANQYMRAEDRVIRTIDAYAAKVQVELNVDRGLRVPLPDLRAALAADLRELFAPDPRQRPRFGSRRGDDDDDQGETPLSPAQFLQRWDMYSRGFGAHPGALNAVAKTVKCHLSSAELRARLIADFAGKDARARDQLSRSLLRLIDDSGEQAGPDATDVDFRLMQLAALLKAQEGLSAAAARSVFPNDEVRERVQRAEARVSVLRDNMATIRDLVDPTMMAKPMDGLSETLDLALEYPTEYGLYSELRGQRIAGLDEVKQALADDEAVVQFVPAGDRLTAIVVRRDRAVVIKLPQSAEALRPAATGLLGSMQLPPGQGPALPPKFRADLAWSLHQSVWQPLEAALLGARTVYLVPGETLAGVPFQALLRTRPPAQVKINFNSYRKLEWLGEKYSFVTLPSLHGILRTAGRSGPTESPKLFGVGEPAISSATLRTMGLEGIPGTTQLLQRSGKPGDPDPLLGVRATFGDLALKSRSGIPAESDILLINSHTLLASKAERFGSRDSAIILAPSGPSNAHGADILSPDKVLELKLPVRLAMLLSCETAGVATKGGPEPYAGLVSSFFFAGARSVLSALRPVSAPATDELAINFLRHFRDERMSAAVALQRAAAEVRCPDNASPCAAGLKSVWGHPAYWAQFVLVGAGR